MPEEAIRVCDIAVGAAAEIILNELKSGVCEAWQIADVAFITRIETTANTKELVVVCSQGRGLAQAGEVMRKAAKSAGCKTVRFHTSRPAQQRLLKQFNFRELERVYIMEL